MVPALVLADRMVDPADNPASLLLNPLNLLLNK
jgi:hypothetical protein